jgi:TRAP-type uncharacterized transport system fused permease subunit
VIAAPALTKLGVPDYAAHMFIFYYAVLSEVSPPTALSPFAAAAITGGNPYLTTLQSWKYTMPAFLVPFVFVLDVQGPALLLQFPKGLGWLDAVEVTLKTAAGIAFLGVAAQGWLFRRSNIIETVLFTVAGLLLVFPLLIQGMVSSSTGFKLPFTTVIGVALAIGAAALQKARGRVAVAA